MSFPRAKIQRFNDVLNSVPSPTKYDPKLGDKVKGGCILKGEIKQTATSESALTSSGKSCQTPVFRTPQVPKRHNCLGVSDKGSHSAFKSITFKSDDIEFLNNDGELGELKALRVECSNKTETLNDLEKHIQDLKTQLSHHEKSKAKMETYIAQLELAKSDLECIKSNNENYEQQVNTLQSQIKDLEKIVEELNQTKEDLCAKIEEAEKKNNKLEEANLDYERKLISLEGTIEQLQMEQKNKEELMTEMKQKEEMSKMNHKVSIECLNGKISTLENEIKEMDSNKAKNEAVIFGLETQISSLNCSIENLKTEKNEIESYSKELKLRLKEVELFCKNHEDTITGLEMELESRIKEIQQLKDANVALQTEMNLIKSEIKEEKSLFEEKLNELNKNQEEKIVELNAKFKEQESVFESEKNDLASTHAEEILHLQMDYESKLLAQMQESTDKLNVLQCQLDEKDTLMNKINLQHMKMLEEWEGKLKEAENNFAITLNKLEMQHSENIEKIKDSFMTKIKILEENSGKIIDIKNKEFDLLSKQYKEILEEVKGLLHYLEKKDEEIKNLRANNKTLNSRLKLMLEEIKLLNKDNELKGENLTKMTTKYKEEFNKNEQLSCKLGELDTKIFHLKEDLYRKSEDWKKATDELKKSKYMYDRLLNKKNDLDGMVCEFQEKINKLLEQLHERKVDYDEKVKQLTEELTIVKSHCRKLEIVTGNTSKSLNALRQRLIESEQDVEKLNVKNSLLEKKLEQSDNEKNDFQLKYESMLETKFDLETTLDEYLSNSNKLSEKCNKLESFCNDLENRIQDLTKLNENLEIEKEKHVEALKQLVREHELQMIETERATVDQVEQFSQTLTEKLEFFVKFSTEKVKNLTGQIKNLEVENQEMRNSLKLKTEEYDNLFTDYEILKTTVDISVRESEDLKKKCEEQAVALNKGESCLQELMTEKENVEKELSAKEEKYIQVVVDLENIKKELNEKVDSLKTVEDLNICMKNQVSSLESEVKDLEEQRKMKCEEFNGLEKKIVELETRIQDKDAEIASFEDQKILLIEQIKNLSSEKNDLAFNLKIAETKLETHERLVEELREYKLQLEEDNQKQKVENDSLMAEKCGIESELMCLKEENEKLKRDRTALAEVTDRKNYYKDNCLRLDKLCAELNDENASLKNDFNEIHNVLQDKEKKIEELLKRCSDLESLIGPFREQLERYETERMLIENDREELRKQHLEQAAKLGHSNHKQKIQHVVNLKNTLLESRKENEKLTLEIKNLKKKVEKLQEQLGHDPKRLFIGGKRPAATPFKGKENSGLKAPSTGMIPPMTVKQEPMSPGSPLRNRNH